MKYNHLLLIIAILLASSELTAQDLIYRKNNEIIKANILSTTDNSVTYKRFDNRDSTKFHISYELIDSIIYRNGKRDKFQEKPIPIELKPESRYNHHLFGIDVFSFLIFNNLAFSYEFLPGKEKIGYKIVYTTNLEQLGYYPYSNQNYQSTYNWTTKIGVNYYFNPPHLFRFGTGLNYIFGSVKYMEYSYDINYLTNEYSSYEIEKVQHLNGLVLNMFLVYHFSKHFALNINPEYFLLSKKEKNSYNLKVELLINF